MIFIAGATGFTGRHLVDYLLLKGLRPRCLVRSDSAARSLSAKGCDTVRGDITSADTLKIIINPGDFVIHLVGLIEEKRGMTFHSVHVEGTQNLVSEAVRSGAGHFFYQSALGADRNSWSSYLRTKGEAEDIVIGSGLPFTIFRPSLIIGPWDGFTKKMADVIRRAPVLPMPGDGTSRFQPVYIRDWLRCIEKVIDDPKRYRSAYNIGGPEQLTYSEIVGMLSDALGIHKKTLHIPMPFMKFAAGIASAVFPSPPVTIEQLGLLEQDNICDPAGIERQFGFIPVRYKDALRDFIR